MKQIILTIFLLLVAVTALFSFDGKKKGFLLGFGVGGASVAYSQTVEYAGQSFDSPTESVGAFATDFKMGYAPTNNLEIYYTNQVAWFTMRNGLNEDVTIADGVSGVGISYFFSQSPTDPTFRPSLFFSVGVGLSAWDTPLEEEAGDPSIGVGSFFGVGCEVVKHHRVSLNLFVNNPTLVESGVTLTTNSTAILLTYGLMAF